MNDAVWRLEGLEARYLLAAPVADVTFGSFGRIVTWSDEVNAIARQPNGKFDLICGITATPTGFNTDAARGRIAQFNADGTRDTSFAGVGTRRVNFNPVSAAVDSLGNVLVAGRQGLIQQSSTPGLVVARIKLDGSYDARFGGGGIVKLSLTDAPLVRQVWAASGPAGGVLVFASIDAGFENATSSSVIVFHLDSRGRPIASFGKDGRQLIINSSGTNFAVLPDGKFLLAGGGGTEAPDYLLRLNADASIDDSFNSHAFMDTGNNQGYPPGAIAGDAQGRVYLAEVDQLFRLRSDGSIDTSYGKNGRDDLSIQDVTVYVRGIAIAPDGKITLVGDANGTAYDRQFFRFNPDGSNDETFGTHGVILLPSSELGPIAAILPDGNDAWVVASNGGAERLDSSPDVQLAADGTLYARADAANETITLAASGGSAVLTVGGQAHSFPLSDVKRFVCLATNFGDVVTDSLDIDCRVRGENTSNVRITTAGGDDEIEFTEDSFNGGTTFVSSGAGNDTIEGGEKATIDSGDGDDLVTNVSGTVNTGDGNDTVRGGGSLDAGSGDDVISGDFGTILGGEGNDTISSSLAVSVDAGAGDDVVDILGSNSNPGDDNVAPITILGGDGNDRLSAQDGTFSVSGGDGNDLIRAFGRFETDDEDGQFTVIYDEEETLIGGNGNDTMFGGEASDTFFGNAGNDVIHVNAASDYVAAGGGNDKVFGGGIIVNCGPGNDRVIGNASRVNGGPGDDFIQTAERATGGDGNDIIYATTGGNCVLDGGAGDDVFFTRNTFSDTIEGGLGDDSATRDVSIDVLHDVEHDLP